MPWAASPGSGQRVRATRSARSSMSAGATSTRNGSGATEGSPVLGVLLHEVLDDVAIDGVDEDEAALGGRVLGRVHEDAPHRPAAQPAPPERRRGVPEDPK